MPHDEPALPLTVDTAWPAAAHVCRAARDTVLSSGAILLRRSPTAGIAVPYRRFIPAIDTLYVGLHQSDAVFARFFAQPEIAALARALRHVAVEMSGARPDQLATLARQWAVDLRTISVVLAGTGDSSPSMHRSFLPPARRCRLFEIAGEALERIEVGGVWFNGRKDWGATPVPLADYPACFRRSMDQHVRDFSVVPVSGDGTAWRDADGGGFGGVEIKVQTFVEYHINKDDNSSGAARWIEVCEDRILSRGCSAHPEDETVRAPHPREIAVADRKNPTEYRVLDDDTRWYSLREYNADMQRVKDEWIREGRARRARGEMVDPFTEPYEIFINGCQLVS